MGNVPPGIKFLIRLMPKFFLGDILAYFLQRLIENTLLHTPLPVSLFLFNVLYGWIIAVAVVRINWHSIQIRRKALATKAVLPPIVQGLLPGNIDILGLVVKSYKEGYPLCFLNSRDVSNLQVLPIKDEDELPSKRGIV